MSYLHYQHSVSNFGVAKSDEYRVEYFTEEDDKNNNTFHHYSLSRITNYIHCKKIGLSGLIKHIFLSQEAAVIYTDGKKDFYTYDPLVDTPELYLEMNKIKVFDENSLLKFIYNYGLPFNKRLDDSENEVVETKSLFPRNETINFFIEMDVLMFYEELLLLQNALNIWKNIKEENTSEMKNIKKQFEKISQTFINEHSTVITTEEIQFQKALVRSKERSMIWDEVKNKDLKSIALSYLNLKLKTIKSGETSTRFTNGKIVPAIKFNNLLEVAGYQLKQAIFKDQKLDVCLNCGALFEARHSAQKFCSPLPRRKRSTCENTYNQRKKRMRKKIRS